MDDQRWRSIEAVYLAALDAPDRAAFLRDACGHDSSLYAAVETLLKEQSTVSVFGSLASLPRPSRIPLAPGTKLGPYLIESLIGSGGSSDVYKASDLRLNRYVALKVFGDASVTEDFRSRFTRESRAAASLNHPNIATVYEVGESVSPWFIAMEYVDGRTLRAAFSDSTCSLTDRLGYLRQAASALARAHANGIAHCDLKPDNIMVTHDGLVKVLDFGLVRLTGLSEAGVRVEGTIGYMSPEQAAGQAIDARSDVFSFGCVLFEAVTGQLPFWNPSVQRWVDNLMDAPPPRLAAVARDVPAGLQELVDDCLVKDPEARRTSMNEVQQRLAEALRPAPKINRLMLAISVIALAALAWWQWPVTPYADSIAVIPFVGADETVATAAQNVSRGIRTALSELPDIKVIAESSSLMFSGETLDVPRAAKALGVRTVVTGTVSKTDGGFAISVNFANGEDGSRIWGDSITVRPDDIGAIEIQLATAIASRTRADMTAADARRIRALVHPDAAVENLLWQGRYELSLYDAAGAKRAVDSFKAALGKDPDFALAHAELAKAHRLLAVWGVVPPAEALRDAEREAAAAIQLDAGLSEPYVTLAAINRDRWRWEQAEEEYRRAIDINPNNMVARRSLAVTLTVMGRGSAALEELARAREFDPTSVETAALTTAVFYNLRMHDRALATVEQALRRHEFSDSLWAWLGIVSGGGKRDFEKAVRAFERSIELHEPTTATRAYYVHALAKAGREADALAELKLLEKEAVVPTPSLAVAYLGFGDRARALEQLEAGFRVREPLLQYIAVESYLDDVNTNPRFLKLVAGMQLPLRR